jgi:hypothetical protein
MKKKFILRYQIFAFIVSFLLVAGVVQGKDEWIIPANTTKTVNATTSLSKLTIEDKATLTAPDGYRLTMTVDGVETGQVLEKWTGLSYKFAPGTYTGDIVLTVAKANDVSQSRGGGGGGMPGAAAGAQGGAGAPSGGEGGSAAGGMPGGAAGGAGGGMPSGAGGGMPGGAAGGTGGGMPGGAGGAGGGSPAVYQYRQALYLDAKGIDTSKSVLASVQGKKPSGFNISDIEIKSQGTLYKDETSPGGTGFNGIYIAGGTYNLKNIKINFFGDGRSDFMGYGSAIVITGKDTKAVLDNVTIKNQGIVRAGIIVKDSSKAIVKNSNIECKNGVLPPGYVATMDTSQMRSTLWISGMTGNVRATSLMGKDSEATYINSSISSEGWGALSTDGTNGAYLNAINCKVNITGPEGYGNYNDPDAHVAYYGTEFNMATFASVIGSGDVYYGDSTPEAVSGLNEKFGLGLTAAELKSIPNKPTVINSKKYGVMWHRSGNPLTVDGGTVFNTAKTTFIISGVPAVIKMDGSKGAKINAGNGVVMQVASDDQPADMSGNGYYEEPAAAPKPVEGFDNTSTKDAATANFSNIDLKGDFYNSVGWGKLTDKLNMVLNLNKSSITGVVSASESHHPSAKITTANLTELHSLTDKSCAAVNNGVIVNLTNGSKWTVTGTSYLTKLVIEKGSSVAAPSGRTLTMTVDGGRSITNITTGEYKGNIVLMVK